eukprot:6214276-Pleurochrysis_carterae.AAC.1
MGHIITAPWFEIHARFAKFRTCRQCRSSRMGSRSKRCSCSRTQARGAIACAKRNCIAPHNNMVVVEIVSLFHHRGCADRITRKNRCLSGYLECHSR